MIYSKLEPQSDEGSVDTDCSTTQNQIPRAKVHLGQRMNPDGPLEAYDPGGGVALSDGADFERLDAARTTKIIGAKPTSCSMAMALKTMPLDGHLQAEESGKPCSHLKRPDDTKNHVRTTVSKTAGCGNDKYVRQARTSSPHEVIVYPVLPAHICCTASLTCIATAAASTCIPVGEGRRLAFPRACPHQRRRRLLRRLHPAHHQSKHGEQTGGGRASRRHVPAAVVTGDPGRHPLAVHPPSPPPVR